MQHFTLVLPTQRFFLHHLCDLALISFWFSLVLPPRPPKGGAPSPGKKPNPARPLPNQSSPGAPSPGKKPSPARPLPNQSSPAPQPISNGGSVKSSKDATGFRVASLRSVVIFTRCTRNPFSPKLKKYILPIFSREIHKWGSENW